MERSDLDALDFDKGDGLVPVIAQHYLTGEVLMLGYATRDRSQVPPEIRNTTEFAELCPEDAAVMSKKLG